MRAFRARRRFNGRPLFGWQCLEPRRLLAADLIANWQAQDLVDGTEDGATIQQWTDAVSGIAAIAQGRPTISHSAMGGQAAVRFDPSDEVDLFRISSLVSPMRDVADFTLTVVFSTNSSTLLGGNDEWFKNTAIVDANSLGLTTDWGVSINATGQLGVGIGAGFVNPPATLYSSSAGYNDGQTHLAIFRRQGDAMSLQLDDQPPVTLSGVNDAMLSSVDMIFGAQKRGIAPLDGLIGEVRVYDGAIDSAETQAVYSEFVSRYNNRAPLANADQYTLVEDALLLLVPAADGVLANDTDSESDPLTATLVQGAQNGTLKLADHGGFVYAPNADFFGVDTFTYSAVDFRPSAPTTVTLNVTPVHDGVTTTDDSYKAVPGEILSVDALQGVLANDLNPDRAALGVQIERTTDDGSLTLNADGSFTYDPQGFAGTTSFQYRVDDGVELSEPTLATMIVNTPPSAVGDQYELSEDVRLLVVPADGLMQNDSDADGDVISVQRVDGPSRGTLQLQADGSFTYVGEQDFVGTDQFSYRLTDGVDSSPPVIVTLIVQSVNDPPVAVKDSYFTLPSRALAVPAERGPLANDTDVDGPFLRAALVDAPAHGTLELSDDGAFQYTPQDGFIGDDLFSYVADDSIDQSPVTEVRLTVSPRPLEINEFMASNAGALETRIRDVSDETFRGELLTPDWIELRNLVSEPLDVTGMHLTDDPEELTKWTFPVGTVIPPDGYLVVFASGQDVRDPNLDENGRLHTNFNINSDGDYLAVTAQDGTVIHEIDPEFPPQIVNVSYGLVGGALRYFDPPTPGAANERGLIGRVADTTFSVKRGYYTEDFPLEVTTATVGATLVYTTDGTEPSRTVGTQVAPTAPNVAPLAMLTIDKTTTLRVMAYKDDYVSTNIDTQTYFKVGDLAGQSNLWSTVTDDPIWGPQLTDSLMSLPAISLVLDGRISESREVGTSVELIFPDGTEGFQIDAGVEHYGGHSLNSPKKNMRLSFKSIYGDSSLLYDLFGAGAADEFNQLLLRGGSHDTWFWTHPGGGRGNYVRNRWAFDRQLEMGQLAPRGRYVQVFINGEYWGMHHLMERPNASFMASYLGGTAQDYDALNAGTPLDGDTVAWRALQSNDVIDDYQQVQQYLDVGNYADYMLLQFYAGNDWDWNTSQNWAAARKREDGAGFIFFSWDSDVMLRTTAGANVIARGGPGNLWNIRGGLKQHEDFLMLMADRAHRYFFNDGMLTSERLRQDIDALADEIRLPVIAETARWGRFGFQNLKYTPDVWQGSIDWMKDTFAPTNAGGRTATMITQLRQAGIYPSVDAPEYTVNGARQHGGSIARSDTLGIVAAEGTVYYTTDGTDPRLPGGQLDPRAQVFDGGPIVLDGPSIVKARVRTEDEWSALSEAQFLVDTVAAAANNLRISEINYHPADPTAAELAAGFDDGDDFEYIELVNLSKQTVDLSDVRLERLPVDGDDQGVDFIFATGSMTLLAPGQRVLVVENLPAFEARYGSNLPVAGQWSGGLSNQQEQISLSAAGAILQRFTYSDAWYVSTDGAGRTLDVMDPSQDLALWSEAAGWRASVLPGGSPGSGDQQADVVGDSNRDGVFNSDDLITVFQAGEYEDLTAGNSTWVEGDWDGDGDFTSSDLIFAFQAGSYVNAAVFQEAAVAQETADLTPLAARDRIFEGWS